MRFPTDNFLERPVEIRLPWCCGYALQGQVSLERVPEAKPIWMSVGRWKAITKRIELDQIELEKVRNDS